MAPAPPFVPQGDSNKENDNAPIWTEDAALTYNEEDPRPSAPMAAGSRAPEAAAPYDSGSSTASSDSSSGDDGSDGSDSDDDAARPAQLASPAGSAPQPPQPEAPVPHPIRTLPLEQRCRQIVDRLISARRARVDPPLDAEWSEDIESVVNGLAEIANAEQGNADGGEAPSKSHRAETDATDDAARSRRANAEALVRQAKRLLRWRNSREGLSMAVRFAEATMRTVMCSTAVHRGDASDAPVEPLTAALAIVARELGSGGDGGNVESGDSAGAAAGDSSNTDAAAGGSAAAPTEMEEWIAESCQQTWVDLGDHGAQEDEEVPPAPPAWRRDVLEVLLAMYGHSTEPARRVAAAVETAPVCGEDADIEPFAKLVRIAPPCGTRPYDAQAERRYGLSGTNLQLVLEECRNDHERACVAVNLARATLGVTTVPSIVHVTGLDPSIVDAVVRANGCSLRNVRPRRSVKPSELSGEIPPTWDVTTRAIDFVTTPATKTTGPLTFVVVCTLDGVPVYVSAPRENVPRSERAQMYARLLQRADAKQAMLNDSGYVVAPPELEGCECVMTAVARPMSEEQRRQAHLTGILFAPTKRTVDGLCSLPLLQKPEFARLFSAADVFTMFRVALFAASAVKALASTKAIDKGLTKRDASQLGIAAAAGHGQGGGSQGAAGGRGGKRNRGKKKKKNRTGRRRG